MSYKPSDNVVTEFVTSASTGAATNADSLPTGTINHNGTDDGTVTVSVTNLDAGRYKASFTIPSGYAAGDDVILTIAATIGGTAAKNKVWEAVLDSKRFADVIGSQIPSANAGAVGGLPLAVDTSGRVDVLKINGTSQTARDIGASVLLSAGTGTGQLDFTSGVVKSNLAQILGTALTETAGFLAAGFKKFFNVSATPSSTMDSLTLVATTTTVTNPVSTTYPLKKNTGFNNFEFPMRVNGVDTTGLTVSGQVSIDGAAFVNLTNAVAEVGLGIYKVNLAAADLNGNVVTLRFTASGASNTLITIPLRT